MKEDIRVGKFCTNFREYVVNKRNEKRISRSHDFLYEDDFANWCDTVEDLRQQIIVTALNIRGLCDEDTQTKDKTAIYESFRKCLTFFNYFNKNEKVKPYFNTYNALLIMIGKGVSTKEYDKYNDFVFNGKDTFRRDLEDYIADLIIKENEERTYVKKVKCEARRAKRQSEAAAKRADKEKPI